MIVKLSNSKKRLIIDNIDRSLLKFDWRLSPDGYARTTICGIRWYIHRYIMKPPLNMVVDHIDGDKLNNHRSNLRICSHRENVINSSAQKHKLYSKYKGVSFCSTEKRIKKWVAACELHGKRITIGRFHTEIEAAKAYNKEAKKLFGKYAKLNII